jgi:hypothetical protein
MASSPAGSGGSGTDATFLVAIVARRWSPGRNYAPEAALRWPPAGGVCGRCGPARRFDTAVRVVNAVGNSGARTRSAAAAGAGGSGNGVVPGLLRVCAQASLMRSTIWSAALNQQVSIRVLLSRTRNCGSLRLVGFIAVAAMC